MSLSRPIAEPPTDDAPGVGAAGPVPTVRDPDGRRTWTGRRPGLWAFPLYLVVQLCLLAVLRAVAPRFFWFDDAQIQFMPMYWWLGRQLGDGSLPLLDPDQGMAGNLTADMQNGTLDVLRWPFMVWAGDQQDLVLVSTVHGWVCLLVLGAAALALLLNHHVRPALAVATALGVTTSGFLIWYGPAWTPSMWSLAALVWLWASLSSRRWYGVLGVGLAFAAAVGAGNPYIWPLLPILVACQAYERWRVGGRAVLRERRTWSTVLALLAGTVLSAPTLVNALDVAPWMWRLPPAATIGAAGTGTNLLDIVVGGPTLLNASSLPIFSTTVIALPLVALVDWRRAVRGPGVVTAAALWIAAVLWTQLPDYFLVFRIPFRLLSVVQVAFGLLVVLALTAATTLTRRRVAVAAGLIGLQLVVATMRSPVLWRWHVIGLLLAVAGLAAVVLLLRPGASPLRFASRRWVRPAAAATVLAVCASTLPLQLALQSTVQERYELIVLDEDQEGVPIYRPQSGGYDVGTTVEEFRRNSFATDTSLTVYPFRAFDDFDDRGWEQGVLGGNLNLLAGLRPGYGSLAVWPEGVQRYVRADFQSSLEPKQRAWFRIPEGADVPWVDLLSSNRVLLGVEGAVPLSIGTYFAKNWDQGETRDGWTEYVRREPLPGRVGLAPTGGVSVEDAAPNDGVATLGRPLESYTVSTGDDEGRLVFRTPYWNGFRATLDGRPVEVSAFADAVLQVELPAGVDSGRLEIFFEPIGARVLPWCTGLGALLLVGALVPGLRRDRRAETGRSAG
ncbi:hypothetical protein GCU60_16050 [Blastococcus saxobsidens]|uniref:YfhO family protein n=1 Tax=Blastococcus saxobsidens TaxID=138336 RepID=A0A6L9W5A0_9ACTN|nr:hypothetical protein [Blastococcus saxobsidens]NEK87255.1 hypothetical protein [Blastococcus saxobsidens]